MTKRFLLQSVALSATVAVSGVANAALTVYNSQATFLGAVSSPGVDTYAGFSTSASTGIVGIPITRSAGSYTYTAVASTSTFYGAGTAVNPTAPWLSTNTATDSITFAGFSGGVSGVGAFIFGSNINGRFNLGDLTVVVTDSLGATLSQIIAGTITTDTAGNITPTSFVGFMSTGTITSLVVTANEPTDLERQFWPTVDNLTLGVTAVPEPESYGLMLAGLGMVGAAIRYRRR